jgi:hypothetical protein
MPTGTIWPLDHGTTLGRVQDACLDAEPCDGGVRSRRVTVLDDAYENSDGSFGCDDGHGGGPLATPEAQRDAIRFGVFNTLVHAERAMAKAEQMVGRQLPRLLVRIGGHGRWGGGHYRLPALALDPEEAVPPVATGEVHLGRGTRYVASPVGRYFNAASHNAAIIAHEVGHHLCRHTADFRLNSQRPPNRPGQRQDPARRGHV